MKADQRKKVRDLVDQVMTPFEEEMEKIRRKARSMGILWTPLKGRVQFKQVSTGCSLADRGTRPGTESTGVRIPPP
jgi:hypothetical protein